MAKVFTYTSVYGLTSDSLLPYTATGALLALPAPQTRVLPVAVVVGTTYVTAKSVSALMNALQSGPISVAIAVLSNAFMYYKSGVFSGCLLNSSGGGWNHAVVLTGYGTDPVSGNYWIIKNSWGTSWGEAGYMRPSMKSAINNGYGECGILYAPQYPTIN